MQIYRIILGHNRYFGIDISVESLFNDLNAKECTALYKLIFNNNRRMNYEQRYDSHNPIERETLKQRAINEIQRPSRTTNVNIER